MSRPAAHLHCRPGYPVSRAGGPSPRSGRRNRPRSRQVAGNLDHVTAGALADLRRGCRQLLGFAAVDRHQCALAGETDGCRPAKSLARSSHDRDLPGQIQDPWCAPSPGVAPVTPPGWRQPRTAPYPCAAIRRGPGAAPFCTSRLRSQARGQCEQRDGADRDGEATRPIARYSTRSVAGAWQFPLLVWAVHFLLTQVPATLAYHYGTLRSVRMDPPRSGHYVPDFGPESGAYGVVLAPPCDGLAHWLVEPFRSWDGTWYQLVATGGYDPDLPATAAFWPLYPWLMRIGSTSPAGRRKRSATSSPTWRSLGPVLRLPAGVARLRRPDRAAHALGAGAVSHGVLLHRRLHRIAVPAPGRGRAVLRPQGEWLLAGLIGSARGPHPLRRRHDPGAVRHPLPPAVWLVLRAWFPRAFAAALPALGPVIFGWTLQRSGLDFFDWADQQWQWNRFSASLGAHSTARSTAVSPRCGSSPVKRGPRHGPSDRLGLVRGALEQPELVVLLIERVPLSVW